MTDFDPLPASPDEKHFGIAEIAARNLGLLIEGNRLSADQLRVSKHDTEVHQIAGMLTVALAPDITQDRVAGTRAHGEVLGSSAAVTARAEALAVQFAATESVQKEIIAALEKKTTRGFGAENFTLPLPGIAKKDFAVAEKCPACLGTAQTACQPCHATGVAACPLCQGSGSTPCTTCHGAGAVTLSDGSRQSCNRCQGQGRVICAECNGVKTKTCPHCHGQRHVACIECGKTGVMTQIFDVRFHGSASFAVERQGLPPAVLGLIDKIGAQKIALEEHAEIFRQAAVIEGKKIVIPFVAFLPLAAVEFSVEGKIYPAVIAGLNGHILEMEPLLDAVIKPGISALHKLSKGPMATGALMDAACRYALIRGVLSDLTHMTRRAAYNRLRIAYPVGLSEKYAKGTVKYAAAAIENLALKPKRQGLIAGILLGGLLGAAWYLGGLREMAAGIFAQRHQPKNINGADLAVAVAGCATAYITIRYRAGAALRKLLPESVRTKGSLPPAGIEGFYAALAVVLIMLGLAAFAPVPPGWMPHG